MPSAPPSLFKCQECRFPLSSTGAGRPVSVVLGHLRGHYHPCLATLPTASNNSRSLLKRQSASSQEIPGPHIHPLSFAFFSNFEKDFIRYSLSWFHSLPKFQCLLFHPFIGVVVSAPPAQTWGCVSSFCRFLNVNKCSSKCKQKISSPLQY